MQERANTHFQCVDVYNSREFMVGIKHIGNNTILQKRVFYDLIIF